MKNIRLFGIFLLCLTGILSINHAQDVAGKPASVRMGSTRVNITPEVPVPMTGYASRTEPYTGVHDSLFATALYFESPDNALLLITADLIGYSFQFIEETRKRISAEIGMVPENIVISAVHNHGAPVSKAYERDVPETVEEYVQDLQDTFVAISVQASESLTPVKMGTGKSHCELNINRRAEFADGGIWLGRASDKPCDHEVSITRFDDLENRTLAVLINWPCHATASGPGNTQITGDWPGAASRYFNEQAGDEVVVAITAGASGDINPIYGPGNDFNEIEAVGYHVGKTAWESYQQISTLPVETLEALNTTLILPGKKRGEDRFPQETYEPGPDVEISLTTFRIGHLVLAGISGELMNEIGTDIKKKSPFSNTVIMTHCNGSSGYICTDKAFAEGGYEIQVTRLMPGAETVVRSELLQMISGL
jgi:hypothetical protein